MIDNTCSGPPISVNVLVVTWYG